MLLPGIVLPRLPSTGSKQALVLFVVVRLLLSGWAIVVLSLLPADTGPDETVRPYVGAPYLDEGASGRLLGPWQRFDTMRYLAVAREGYTVENSVFPPLYPFAVRALGALLRPAGLSLDTANLLAAILISNAALLAALILLYRLTVVELNEEAATRSLLYLLFFPTGFFLYAPYTESLFLLLALSALISIRRGRPLLAGGIGFLASLTRLTGWGLLAPLGYEYLRQHQFNWRRLGWRGWAVFLPPLALAVFMGGRMLADLPPMSEVYQEFWYQQTGFPGRDLLITLRTLLTGEGPRAGEFTLLFDLLTFIFLAATTVLVFYRLGPTYGLYNVMMLLFMLLPSSDLKPLYSFSRYALAFFPTFMMLGEAGSQNRWLDRLIFYSFVALYFYFSGQFFVWGWVA